LLVTAGKDREQHWRPFPQEEELEASLMDLSQIYIISSADFRKR